MRRAFIVAALACLTTACVVGPDYRRPPVATPSAIRGQNTPSDQSIADLPWWELFRDESLTRIIRTALANNNDLRIAVVRIEQARQGVVQARAGFLPGVGYNIAASGGQNETLGNPIAAGGRRQGAGAIVFAALWEADVWGRIRRSKEAALADYLRTEQARRGVLLSLVCGVARTYLELLGLDLRLQVARRNVEAFQQSYRLFDERLRGGTASRLETERARAAAASTASNIPELERQIALLENEIRLLLGAEPGPIEPRGALLEQIFPPDVPAGLPSSLLERRPDVLEAEAAMRAVNAQIGLATAAFFPRIGLTALLGRVSSPLNAYLSGAASVWGGASSAAGPIYAGRALKARQRQAAAFWEESRIRYEQTVLGAFRDVSNALIAREKLEQVQALQTEAVNAYREAVTVALQRYSAGKSSYLEVLDAQSQLFPAETALAVTELQRRLAIVQLYQALGGGWKIPAGDWKGPGQPGPPPTP